MWIEQRTENNYKFVEQYKDPLTNKYHRVSITFDRSTTHTRKKANQILEQKIHSRLSHYGLFQVKKHVTLNQLGKEWLIHFQHEVKFNTYRNNKSRVKEINYGLGANTLVEKITPLILSNYLEQLIYDQGYRNSTVQKFKGTLNSMFKYGIKHQYLNQNPLNLVDINYRNSEYQKRPEQKYLDEDELLAVLKFMYQQSAHYGRFCEFLYLTGMRYGETAALTPQDIQFNSSGDVWVAIQGTIVNGKKQPSPKSSSSWRNVTLPPRAIKICQDELLSHPKRQQFLFVSERGNYLGNTVLNNWLHKAKNELNINKVLTLHTFRHTHISKLVELGVPLYLIQARVGHKNAATTTNIYLHVTKKANHLLNSKLKDL